MSKEFLIDDPYALAEYIGKAEKKTPVTAYIVGNLTSDDLSDLIYFGSPSRPIIKTTIDEIAKFLKDHEEKITYSQLELDRRNSAIDLLDLKTVNARIEPGALIREHVFIGENAVVMMGAVINIGASVGEGTMVDMNAVIGGRAEVGKNSHIGAGAVIAGVIEPPSSSPVRIGDNVLVGANSVVLEGVQVGNGAVIAAGSVVTEDVPENAVVAGSPARIIKEKDNQTEEKTQIMNDLRNI